MRRLLEKRLLLIPRMVLNRNPPNNQDEPLCLEQVRGGETVLDVGTGSGVLSIASSLLGAKEIFAYDLDDVAVRVVQKNMNSIRYSK